MNDRTKFANLFVFTIVGITCALLILLAVFLIVNPASLIILRYGLAAVSILIAVYLIIGLVIWKTKKKNTVRCSNISRCFLFAC